MFCTFITWFTKFQFDFIGGDGVSIVRENITRYDVGKSCARATAEMTFALPNIGNVVQHVKWFSGVDKDSNDNVSYYFGVRWTTNPNSHKLIH